MCIKYKNKNASWGTTIKPSCKQSRLIYHLSFYAIILHILQRTKVKLTVTLQAIIITHKYLQNLLIHIIVERSIILGKNLLVFSIKKKGTKIALHIYGWLEK